MLEIIIAYIAQYNNIEDNIKHLINKQHICKVIDWTEFSVNMLQMTPQIKHILS